jgi:hypothetical protein
MSDESQFTKPEAGRLLRPEEAALIRALAGGAPFPTTPQVHSRGVVNFRVPHSSAC